jgi:hypothetical protein
MAITTEHCEYNAKANETAIGSFYEALELTSKLEQEAKAVDSALEDLAAEIRQAIQLGLERLGAPYPRS